MYLFCLFYSQNDLNALAVILANPEVMRFSSEPKTQQQTQSFIEGVLASYEKQGHILA